MNRRTDKFADKVRDSGTTLYVFTISFALFVCGVILTVRDFLSNYHGYIDARQLINVEESMWEWVVVIAVSVLIQFVSTLSMYSAMLLKPTTATENYLYWLAIVATIAFLSIDVYFGYQHYILPESQGVNALRLENWDGIHGGNIRQAFIESLVLDTVFSEALLSWTVAMLFSLYPDLKRYVAKTKMLSKLDSYLPDIDHPTTNNSPRRKPKRKVSQ